MLIVFSGGASSWLGGLSHPNKNTIEQNRGVARGNMENVRPIPGKLEN